MSRIIKTILLLWISFILCALPTAFGQKKDPDWKNYSQQIKQRIPTLTLKKLKTEIETLKEIRRFFLNKKQDTSIPVDSKEYRLLEVKEFPFLLLLINLKDLSTNLDTIGTGKNQNCENLYTQITFSNTGDGSLNENLKITLEIAKVLCPLATSPKN